jgi:hypothetical protein
MPQPGHLKEARPSGSRLNFAMQSFSTQRLMESTGIGLKVLAMYWASAKGILAIMALAAFLESLRLP